MKIKFGIHDDLPLNKLLNLHMLTIIVRSAFEVEGLKDECLYEI